MVMDGGKVINTLVGQNLSAALEKAREQGFVAVPLPPPKPKQEKESESPADHQLDTEPSRAVIIKGGNYRQLGPDFLAANANTVVGSRSVSAGEVYGNFDRPYLGELASLVRECATFPGGLACNFNPGAKGKDGTRAGQQFPYPWEAHHMIPESAFYRKDSRGEPAFKPNVMCALMKTKYDLNDGTNIIMLPAHEWGVPVHALLQHPSDHPEYTRNVIRKMQSIQKDLETVANAQLEHKGVDSSLHSNLLKLQDELWDMLVDLGRAVVDARYQNRELVHEHSRHVLFKAKRSGTKYEFGRLY